MRKAAPLLILRLALFAALFASAVLLVDYNNLGDPSFCGSGSGCMAVRRSGYSSLGPFQLPALGLIAYGALFMLAITARARAHTLFIAVGTAIGALGAVTLFVLQGFVIHAFCKWCVIVDSSAIVAAVAAIVIHLQLKSNTQSEAELVAFQRLGPNLAWGVGAAVAVALPFVWGEYPVVPETPPAIATLAVPGKITMVVFTDFECPHCRRLSPVFHAIEAENPGRFATVRKMVPLIMHPGAMPAALAYVCVPEDAMAQALYEAPEEQLTHDGVIKIARRATGAEEASFTACLDSPGAKARVEADQALLDSLAAKALPLTYVGPRIVLGADEKKVRKSALLALEPGRPMLPASWMLAIVGVLVTTLFAASAWATRRLSFSAKMGHDD